MTEQEFLEHHRLARNPFVDEDAQTDTVFRDFCISGTFHPSWSKVVGDSKQPATAIVFGAKGSGKTAMRLQLIHQIARHNSEDPERKVFLVMELQVNLVLLILLGIY
jgi:primosomal protein N'